MTEATKTVHPMMADVTIYTIQLFPVKPDRKKLLEESQSWFDSPLHEKDLVFVGDFNLFDELSQKYKAPEAGLHNAKSYLRRKLLSLIYQMNRVLKFRLKELQTEVPVVEMLARGVHRTKIVEEILIRNGVTLHGVQLANLYWCGGR